MEIKCKVSFTLPEDLIEALGIDEEDIVEDDEIPVKSRWKCDDDCDNWWEEDDPNYTDDLYDSFDDDCGQDCSCDECEYFCPNCGNCVLV